MEIRKGFLDMGIRPTSLGKNDLSNLSTFVQTAADLGLLKNGNITPLSKFLTTAVSTGVVGGIVTQEGITECLRISSRDGLISPQKADSRKVATLLTTGTAMGITPMNIGEMLPGIMNKAQRRGIIPQEVKESQQEDKQEAESQPSVGMAISSHKLRFEPYELVDIIEVRMSNRINEHAKLYIKGVLALGGQQQSSEGQEEDQTVQQTNAGETAALYSIDEEGNIERLFQGIIRSIKQTQTTDLKYIEVEVFSSSYLLDIKKKSCSFQQMTATYDDIIALVAGKEVEVQNRQDSKQIGKLIVQYKETNWEFLKRLASHFNTGLVPVVTSDQAQLYFGVCMGEKTKEIAVAAYSVQKKLGDYQTFEANDITHSQPSLKDTDFVSYQIESFDRLYIGDAVTFLEHDLYVQNSQGTLEKGLIKYSYTLVSKTGMVQKDRFNENLIGVSLMAEVKTITKDQIQAHIVEIDPAWDGSADWYFPYSTVFSSPDGSGWYCMPEPGDTVRIHFPNHKDEDAVAASAVNKDQSSQGQGRDAQSEEPRSDPDKKSFSNKYGKEVLFTPDGIYITNQAGQIYINMTDAEGITIVSAKDVVITAKENIYLKADKELLITAGENLTLKGRSSTMKMNKDNTIEIQGDKVLTN